MLCLLLRHLAAPKTLAVNLQTAAVSIATAVEVPSWT